MGASDIDFLFGIMEGERSYELDHGEDCEFGPAFRGITPVGGW